MGEVELGGGEDERVGQHGGAAQPVHLAAAQRTDRPAGQGCNSTDIYFRDVTKLVPNSVWSFETYLLKLIVFHRVTITDGNNPLLTWIWNVLPSCLGSM